MGQLRLHTRWLSAIQRAGANMETLHTLLAPQQPQATMPLVGSSLFQQPAVPSTSSESLRKRKSTDSGAPDLQAHSRPLPLPLHRPSNEI